MGPEAKIERAVCDYAKGRNWLTYKWVSPGHIGVPDRLFISPNGMIVMIEFKREGGKPTPAQYREHDRLKAQGCTVFVVDSVEQGKAVVDAYN